MPAKHYHSYRKIKGNETRVMCLHPDCTHTTDTSLIRGKRVICPACGDGFVVDNYALQFKKIVCDLCHNGKRAERLRNNEARIKKLERALNAPVPTKDSTIEDFLTRPDIRLLEVDEQEGETKNA